MLKQKEQKQIEKDTIQRKELRYGYLIPSDWNYEKMNQTKSKSESAGHRAWLEIDRKALEHNVCLFQRLLPDTCQLMPAVKAQAYGLGAVLIAKELNRLGIQAFCVASAEEGMELRKNGIAGEILILGYTAPEQFALLHTYQLPQTVCRIRQFHPFSDFARKPLLLSWKIPAIILFQSFSYPHHCSRHWNASYR